MNLKDHIQNRSKKANYNLLLIWNICKYINIDTAKMLLCTLVLSHLDYVNSILSRAPTTIVKPYQTTQNFAARIAYKKSKRQDVYTCLQKLHLLPMKYRTIFKLLTIVYNALQWKAPEDFPRTTRQSTSSGITLDILLNKKKTFADRGFSFAVAKYWNDLPEHIRKAKDITKFKSFLKTHFFKLAFPTQ